MGVLISQYRNLTSDTISFRVDNGIFPLRELKPFKTRNVKQQRIIQYCLEQYDPNCWTVKVDRARKFSGVKLTAYHLTMFTRLQFSLVPNAEGKHVLLVEGVEENSHDYLYRNRYLGWSRDAVWDKRPIVFIGRGRSQAGTRQSKRNIEAPSDQPMGTLASPPIHESYDPSDPGQLVSGHCLDPSEEITEEDKLTAIRDGFEHLIETNAILRQEAPTEYEERLLRLEEMVACKSAQVPPIPPGSRAMIYVYNIISICSFFGVCCIIMWVINFKN